MLLSFSCQGLERETTCARGIAGFEVPKKLGISMLHPIARRHQVRSQNNLPSRKHAYKSDGASQLYSGLVRRDSQENTSNSTMETYGPFKFLPLEAVSTGLQRHRP